MAEPRRHFMKDLEAAGLTFNESVALCLCLDYVQEQLRKGEGTFTAQYGTLHAERVQAIAIDTE